MNEKINIFCHPRKYSKEDIDFRIMASEVMAQYKLSQVVTLKEVYDNNVYEFSDTSKEIISFYYDAWSQYMYSVEQLFVRNECNTDDEQFIPQITSMVETMRSYILKTIKANPQYFDARYIKIWETVIQVYREIYKHNLDILQTQNINKQNFFKENTSILIVSLHSLLYIVHELDHLLYNYDGTFFISYDEPCKLYRKYTDKCMVISKLELLLKTELRDKVANAETIIIKIYTNDKININCVNDIKGHSLLKNKNIIFE